MRWRRFDARLWVALAFCTQAGFAPSQRSLVLVIAREFPIESSFEKYRQVEQDAARICAQLNCPNPYVGMESLTGPKEAWWINGFASEADEKRAGEVYARKGPISEALNGISERKRGLIEKSSEVIATYRPELSHGRRWEVGEGRFLVIEVTQGKSSMQGAVFETSDGTRFVIAPARTADEAESKTREGAQIFAVRPYWSMPSEEWIAADPEFWRR